MNCEICHIKYIGQTKRNLKIRFNENIVYIYKTLTEKKNLQLQTIAQELTTLLHKKT